MQVEVLKEGSAFDRLALEWTGLLAESAADTLFLTPSFQRTWWEAFGKEGMLYLLAVRDVGGRLLGLAPLCRQRAEDGRELLRPVGGIEVADYLDIIASRESEEAVLRTLLVHLVGKEVPPWQALELHNVPADSPSRKYLPRLARDLRLGFSQQIEEVCPFIALPSSW